MLRTLRRPIGFAALLSAVAGLAPHRVAADETAESEILTAARTVAAEVADHTVRHWIRDYFWREDDATRYGLKLDDDWQAAAARSPELPLVVLIHGFNSTAARNAAILNPVREAGYPTAAFAYPNDFDIADSAQALSNALRAFATEHPAQKIALVTHSMGGLVARACVEDAELDPGNVTRLVMIAPPTHGSLMAHASFGTDLWEHWLSRRDGSVWRRFRESVTDGLGEASDDLAPGSPFLTRLNARQRNPRVRYSILLGTHGAVGERHFEMLRWTVQKTGRVKGLGRFTANIDNLLADFDEVVDGKGDGVVALKRGRLEGVDDLVELPFDHLTCTGDPGDDAAIRQVQAEVLARLR